MPGRIRDQESSALCGEIGAYGGFGRQSAAAFFLFFPEGRESSSLQKNLFPVSGRYSVRRNRENGAFPVLKAESEAAGQKEILVEVESASFLFCVLHPFDPERRGHEGEIAVALECEGRQLFVRMDREARAGGGNAAAEGIVFVGQAVEGAEGEERGHLQRGRGRAFPRCPGERVPDEKDIPPLKEHELPGNTETAGLIREGRTGEGREGRLEPRSVRVVNTGMAAA